MKRGDWPQNSVVGGTEDVDRRVLRSSVGYDIHAACVRSVLVLLDARLVCRVAAER